MSRLASKRLPVISLMVIGLCVYLFGGVLFRPPTVLGAVGNGRIAYAGTDADSNLQIYTMNQDGSDVQQLTTDPNSHYAPVWSPDGTQIGYIGVGSDGDTMEIFVMDADGSGQTAVTDDAATQNSLFAWSPDGAKIVYTSGPADYSAPSVIKVMNADGSNQVALTDGSYDASTPAWSPDGDTIAFLCSDGSSVVQVCTMNSDGSSQQPITSGTGVDYMDIDYSPDGTQLAYASVSHGGGYIQHLGTMNTDGSSQQTITTQETGVSYASWSPDGTSLVFDNFDNDQTVMRIYTIHADGSGETVISPDDQYARTPSWQPVPADDTDADGTPNISEESAPNGGDANGDGISDKYQPTVTSFMNTVTNQYTVVQSSCTSNAAVSAEAPPAGHADMAFSYPAGLIGFTVTCATAGAAATVTLYHYGLSAQSSMALRKYNAVSHAYTTVSGATITGVTVGGQAATKIVYHVADGGPFDQDGSVNGVIVDPVGLAIPSVGAPNTGMGGAVSFPRNLAPPLL